MAHHFTADPHFGDDGVRRFFGRPFPGTAAMDAAMIAGASAVGHDDDLWIIGDFAACETEEGRAAACAAFDALPGRKHLVRGNHDTDWLIRALPWASVHDIVEVADAGRRFVLCHYPLLSWSGARSGAIQLFGHVHTRWPGCEGQVNVGVDLWDFRPVNADMAEVTALTLPPSKLHRRVEGIAAN